MIRGQHLEQNGGGIERAHRYAMMVVLGTLHSFSMVCEQSMNDDSQYPSYLEQGVIAGTCPS